MYRTTGSLKAYRYIHFAAHGYLGAEDPRFCGLPFPAGDTDALLQTFEIMQLELAAELVVASACQTGPGRLRRGEEMMGLQRAFFYAGAPSACVSLWSVDDDSTKDLMLSFYAHLQKYDKAESLRQEKLHLRKSGRWTHPYYWAAFRVVGDWT
jgi:CHAT domain-containing protein